MANAKTDSSGLARISPVLSLVTTGLDRAWSLLRRMADSKTRDWFWDGFHACHTILFKPLSR